MSTANPPSGTDAKVENLKTMLQFQEHAIVSRILAKTGGGNVTLFAFDAGEGLSEHTAPFDALVIGVEGEAEVMLAGRQHLVGEGDALLMPANTPHAIQPRARFKMLLVMLREAAAR